jgi:hypothetical protein
VEARRKDCHFFTFFDWFRKTFYPESHFDLQKQPFLGLRLLKIQAEKRSKLWATAP